MTPDRERLIAALDQLPMVPRLVYLLAAMDDMDHADIAFRLGLSVQEIEAHLAEALMRLTALLHEP